VQSLTSLDDLLSDNAIEQYVSRLRRRLAPYGLVLRTVRGLGYMLEKPVEVA
jgi:two-component system, OmpR family, response regulator